MKPNNIIFAITVSLCFTTISSYSQLELDLAKAETDKVNILKEESYTFKRIYLINTFPKDEYTIDYKIYREPIEPINYSTGGAAAANNCAELSAALTQVEKYMSKSERVEKEYGEKIHLLSDILNNGGCEDIDLKKKVRELIASSTKAITLKEVIKVKNGEKLTITISRKDITWRFELKGDPVGQWQISYGFGVNSLKGQKGYFSKSIPDNTTYQITKKTDNQALDLEFTPMAIFSFLPYKKYASPLTISASGGLGFDIENPVFFLGGSLFYWQNIGLSLGVAFKKRSSLKGIYSENEVIAENLDFDQLHEDKYRLQPFFSLNFRFKENPFAKKDKDDE